MSVSKNSIINDINQYFKVHLSHFKEIKKISTGGNNIIYKFSVKNKTYVVKYYGLFKDSNDRFKRELNFLKYCYTKNINTVPKLIYANDKNNFSIMNYINGRKITSFYINKKNLVQSVNFISKLNKEKHSTYLYAKDFCPSIQDYLKLVQNRINILDTIDIRKKSPKEFEEIIDEIKKEFKNVINFFNKIYIFNNKKNIN